MHTMEGQHAEWMAAAKVEEHIAALTIDDWQGAAPSRLLAGWVAAAGCCARRRLAARRRLFLRLFLRLILRLFLRLARLGLFLLASLSNRFYVNWLRRLATTVALFELSIANVGAANYAVAAGEWHF